MSGPPFGAHETDSRNEVLLVGRLSAAPVARPLPSGDTLLLWRIIVERGKPSSPGRRRVVDTLTCVSFDLSVQEQAKTWQSGEVVEVRGAIRRRFWRAASGPVSRYEIEVSHARRVSFAVGEMAASSTVGKSSED